MRLQTLRKPLLGVMMVLALGLASIAASGCGNDDTDTASTSSTDSAMASSESEGVMVGGAKMVPNRDIVDNASNAKNVTTLVSLVAAADLVETLKGEGPFTVFGPNNDAFGKLDPATVKSLQDPKNKKTLAKILTYHVVPGTYKAADLMKLAEDGGTLTTVEGGKLTPEIDAGAVVIKDAQGGTVNVETADVVSSNGVTHVVDGVLMP
jgi:uncharacterized surface protein with fasciclin (FAS1) repeats